jgi:protein TonB
LAGVFGGTGTIPGPPAPPPPAPKAEKPAPPPPPQIVQVSAAVQEAKLLQMIQPEYPLSAKMARIQGAVRMRAIINPEGRITALEIFEGHPILRDAARAAVEKWLYRPTYLGERPVSVSTEIVVNFRLTT